jgi:DegV family protein with EDD domain
MNYRIVVESGSDVPADAVERYGITVVPMHIQVGGRNYDDGELPVERLFAIHRQTGSVPKTSGCTPLDFAQAFDRLHKEDPDAHIIHVAYSAQTTCSYESARIAAQGRNYVTSFDARCASAAQALVAIELAEFLERNPNLTLSEVSREVNKLICRVHIAFIPSSLEFLHAGGRLKTAAYLGAQILRIKPVIEFIDGLLKTTQKLRGSTALAIKRFLPAWLEEKKLDRRRLFLAQSAGLEDTLRELAESLAKKSGFKEVRWITTGCVISAHVGPGGFGVTGLTAELPHSYSVTTPKLCL